LLTNTAVAVEPLGLFPHPPALGGRHAAFLGNEAAQAELDQTGDGDTDDYVLQLFDGGTATTASIGWEGGRDPFVYDVGPEHVVYATLGGPPPLGSSEFVAPFLLIRELATGAERRLELPVHRLDVVGSLVLLQVWESTPFGSVDRNGDGDDQDRVAYVHELATGVTHETGLALAELAHAHLDGRRLALLVPEIAQGPADLNGDGDALDFVLHTVLLP
jgi:hypothetical protein